MTTNRTAAAPVVCPWCSAPLRQPSRDRARPAARSWSAISREPLPGITAVDAARCPRRRRRRRRPRNRLLSWISGDYPEDARPRPTRRRSNRPIAAVRREMLRLELEGEVANLKAEADALVAEAAAEGRVVELPAIDALSEAGIAAAEARRTRGSRGDAAAAEAPERPPAGRAHGRRRRRAAADTAAPATDDAPSRGRPARRPEAGTPGPEAAAAPTPAPLSCRGARPPPVARPVVHPRARGAHRRSHATPRGWAARPRRPTAGGWPSCGSPTPTASSRFRDVAPDSGPPADPPLARLGPAVAGALSGLILEDAGRLQLRLGAAVAARRSRPPVARAAGDPGRVPVRARSGGDDARRRARRHRPRRLPPGRRRAPSAMTVRRR